jgi:predicted RND superfamily exporter protein
VISVALIPIILGLGVDYAVHLFHNYRTELEQGMKPGEAIKRSVKEIGAAMFLAWLTTVIAFMSFLSSNIPPIREFGILLALGVTYTFITSVTFLGAARYLLDRNKTIKKSSKKPIFSVRNIMGQLSDIVLRHQKTILFFVSIITIFTALGALQIERGFDMQQFIPADNPALRLYDRLAEDFPYASQDQEYILIEGDIATVNALEGIRRTHENLENDQFVSRNVDDRAKTNSIYTVVTQAINNNQSLIARFNIDKMTGIPETDQDVRNLYDYLYGDSASQIEEMESSEFDDSALTSFQVRSVLFKNNSQYESAVIQVNIDYDIVSAGGNIQDELETLRNELNEDISTYGDATAMATGNILIQLNITNSLTDSQIITTGISLILAALVLIVVYRNLPLGMIAMIPIGISIVWILGTMYYLGYILNVLTVTVTSITIGIGIDYAIHVTERFRLVADKTGDIHQAVCESISRTGGALLIAALTTALGFGILVFAPIPPQQQFGFILAITITYAFITSVLVLPLALARWAKQRKKRKGYIISPTPPKENEDITKFCISNKK